MVPDAPQIEEVLSGQDGLFSTPGDGRLLMVMSTVYLGAMQDFTGRAKAEGWRYVDCPGRIHRRRREQRDLHVHTGWR